MRILLVEDDPSLSRNIEAELVAQGFSVEKAFDGLMAVKILRQDTFDCVVLDINLPLKNGYEVARELRQFDQHTPLLMLTAFSNLEDKLDGFEAGTDDYLTKPFFNKELVARIRALLKRKNPPAGGNAKKYQVGELEIREDQKQAYLNGAALNLTPREFQILLLLARAKGNTVSKPEIIKEIWGRQFDANTNTIEVFINLLRNKIDKGKPDKLIKTRIGYGYYLDAPVYET
ncbi:MAG: response regulator transcription factor [Saprospiraceae bacterium]